MPTVTRKDLVEIVVTDLGCPKGQAKEMVDAFFQAMSDAIGQGNTIEIRGFGTWAVRHRKANPNGRNPMTGERVSVPAKRSVLFRTGRDIREALIKPVQGRE